MVIGYIILCVSAIAAYFSHNFAESLLKRKQRNPRLIIKDFHIHHSLLGVFMIVAAFIFTSSIYTFIIIGYGIGNIWQHKITHNRVDEAGMVLITKVNRY